MLQGEGKIQMRNNAQSKWHLLCQSLEKTSSNMLERAILSVLAIATLNFMMFMSITQSQGKHWNGCYNMNGKFKWAISHNLSVIYILKFTAKAQAQKLTTIVYILGLVTSGLVKFMHNSQTQGLLQDGCYRVMGKFQWEMSHNQNSIYIVKVYWESLSTNAHNNNSVYTCLSYLEFG